MVNKNEVTLNNSLIVANVLSIVSGIVCNIAGNDIANSINNDKVTRDTVETIAVQRLQTQLNSKGPM